MSETEVTVAWRPPFSPNCDPPGGAHAALRPSRTNTRTFTLVAPYIGKAGIDQQTVTFTFTFKGVAVLKQSTVLLVPQMLLGLGDQRLVRVEKVYPIRRDARLAWMQGQREDDPIPDFEHYRIMVGSYLYEFITTAGFTVSTDESA